MLKNIILNEIYLPKPKFFHIDIDIRKQKLKTVLIGISMYNISIIIKYTLNNLLEII